MRFLRTSAPTRAEGIERYLASGMFRGVGPGCAKRLVRAFGTEVFGGIEQSPEKLREVSGIGPLRARRIVRAWADQKVIREMMVFLHGNGVAGRARCGSSRPTATKPCDRTMVAAEVDERRWIFFAGLHRAEPGITDVPAAITAAPAPWPAIDPAKAIPWAEQRPGVMLADSQRDAVGAALANGAGDHRWPRGG
jgi:NAD-dependent DNA ligase